MFELGILMILGLVFGAVLIGFMVHVLLGLLLLPFKIVFGVARGILGALFVVPAIAIGASLLLGGLAVVMALGLVGIILHAIF